MDVLQQIKDDHNELRTVLGTLMSESSIVKRRKIGQHLLGLIEMHLILEGEYLYPEVQGLFKRSEWFIEKSKKNHKNIIKKVKNLNKKLNEKPTIDKKVADSEISKFSVEIENHFKFEEVELMPEMRSQISTQEREDLGEVFLDFKHDNNSATL